MKNKKTSITAKNMGLKLLKPNTVTHAKISKKFDETTKSKKWVSDKDARSAR